MNPLPLLAALWLAEPSAIERATAAWEDGRYPEAAIAYAEAYAQTGDIAYLYARAQSEQRAGNCEAAIATYEAFVATEPLPAAAQAAADNIEVCRASLPPPPVEALPAAPDTPPEVAPAPTSQPTRTSAEAWHRDPAGALLVAFGAGAIGSGIALFVIAHENQAAADRAPDVAEYGAHNDRAVVLSRAAIPVLAVGGALLVGGVIRWALLARGARPGRARAGASAGLLVRF